MACKKRLTGKTTYACEKELHASTYDPQSAGKNMAGHILGRLQGIWRLPQPPEDTEERENQLRRWIVMHKSKGNVRLMRGRYVTREELERRRARLRNERFSSNEKD